MQKHRKSYSFQNYACIPNRIRFISCFFLLAFTLNSCISLDYITGVYQQDTAQKANVLVRVTDRKGHALTDLTLNDFYVKHNGKPLEVSNGLHLDRELSRVKLYLVVLIDQRENPSREQSFEMTKNALKAYLTMQPKHLYIKMISYDNEAHVLNEDFTNDREKLQASLLGLQSVQTEKSAFKEAIALAQDSITNLPYGAVALNPETLPADVVRNTKSSPLYSSAILLLNHNVFDFSSIGAVSRQTNFVILDTSQRLYELKSFAQRQNVNYNTNESNRAQPPIFQVYELPPENLNENQNQSRAVHFINQAWDDLNNIVDGYYWLDYKKYADSKVLGEQYVTVSLNQYSRSQDTGTLYYSAPSTIGSGELQIAENPASGQLFGKNPSDMPKENTPVLASQEKIYDPTDLLAMLPGKMNRKDMGNILAAEPAKTEPLDKGDDVLLVGDYSDTPSINDFEDKQPPYPSYASEDEDDVLGNGILMGDAHPPAPSAMASPIHLVSSEAKHEVEIPPSPADDVPNTYIQVGAYTKLQNLYNVISQLEKKYNVSSINSTVNGKRYNRCILGPMTKEEAQTALNELKASNLAEAFIIPLPIQQWLASR